MNSRRQRFLADGFGGGFAWIDWVNSATWDGFGRLTDQLADPDWVASFFEVYGWPQVAIAPKSALALRARLRDIAEVLAAGQNISPPQLNWVNQVLAAPARRKLSRSSGEYILQLEGKAAGWSWTQSEIVASLAVLLTQHQSRRVKICPNPGCRWLFYDRTNGNTRRWCNDKTCGNRDKVRRLRQRQQRLDLTNS